MAKITDIDITSLLFQEGSAPSTPASTKWRVYAKTTGLFYKDDAGVEIGPLAAASAGIGDHGAAAYNSAAIAINASSATDLTFDSERRDTDAYHSTVSNTGRLTIPSGQDGLYLISGHVRFASNANGYRDAAIVLNGTTTIARVRQNSVSPAQVWICSLTATYALVATDYVTLQVIHNSTTTPLNVEANGNYTPEFRIQRLA